LLLPLVFGYVALSQINGRGGGGRGLAIARLAYFSVKRPLDNADLRGRLSQPVSRPRPSERKVNGPRIGIALNCRSVHKWVAFE
jgi:hypothetical protein